MWSILLIVVIISGTDAEIFFLNENIHEVKEIAKCVVEISNIKKYSKDTIVIYETKPMHYLFNIFKDEIAHLNVDKQIPFIMTNELDEVYEVSKNYINYFLIVIYHQSCEKEIDILIHKGTKYIIVFKENILDIKCNNLLTRTISKLQMYDVTFVLKDIMKVKYYNIVTGVPRINEKTCKLAENITILNINACNNGSLEINDKNYIFPPKQPTDLRMCKLNVGMASLFPYSTIEDIKTLKNLDSLKDKQVYGSDIEIMKIFAKHYNATFEFYYINRADTNPDFHRKYIDHLINGTLDVCAGGLYYIYGDIVEYSGIYSRQFITWVYTVERQTRSWQKLMEKTGGLYIFLIFQVSYSLIWKMLSQFDGETVSWSDTILYSWGALTGSTSLHEARSLKQKLVNISYLLMCIYLSSYISTQMYYYLTIDDPPQTIKTMDELVASDRTPYLIMKKKYFVNNTKYTTYANTSRDCEDFYDCERLMLKYRGSTILIDGFLPRLQSSTTVKDEARVMRVNENILVVYHCIVMRKDSPLNNKVRDVISRLFEAGICDKLYYDAIGVIAVDKSKIAVKNMLSKSYSCTVGCKITMPQLAGAFYLWMIGSILSFFIFIVEILIKKEK